MANDEVRMFGRTPQEWQALPQYLQVHILESNMTLARSHHANREAREQAVEAQLWAFAGSVINWLLGINAGALVAILAFLGALIQSRPEGIWILPLGSSLIWFFAGATTAILAAIVAFFTGSAQSLAIRALAIRFEEPFLVPTDESVRQFDRADTLRNIAIGLIAASLFQAGVGAALFLQFAVFALRT